MSFRVVADTNTVVSGLLWQGPPRVVLDAARAGAIHLFTSAPLLAELDDVLARQKLKPRLALVGATPRELILGFAALAAVIAPAPLPTAVAADPDDDAVLACALAVRAQVIVSGDQHLRILEEWEGIPIVSAAEFVDTYLPTG